MLQKTLICGFAFAALAANTAWAGEKSGHIFGGPVIFESSLSYGWMRDTSDQGIARRSTASLIVNNAQGGTFLAVHDNPPGVFSLVPPTTLLNYDAPQINASLDSGQLFDGGFSHSQELAFGIRSEIADGLEGFIRFEYARFKTASNNQENVNILANATTRYGRSTPLFGIVGPHFIEPGQLRQTFTGTGLLSAGLSDADVFNFNIGIKKDVFQNFEFANIQTQPFIDIAFGLAFTNEITVGVSGGLPDVTDIATADFHRTFVFIDSPGLITQLPTRAITASANVSQSTQIARATVKPTLIVGTGFDFSIGERTTLSLDIRYKYLELDTNFENQKINLSRVTAGLRLSQNF